jgi:hypothetical protein
MHYTIRVLQSCPELGLQPGNLITYEPGLPPPDYRVYVHRPLPANLTALFVLLENGGAEILTPHSTVSDFAEAVGWPAGLSAGPPSAAPLRASGRALRLEP